MRDEYDIKNLNPRKNPYIDRLRKQNTMKADRDERIAVFEDTFALCKKNERLKESIRQSIASQRLIREGDEIVRVASSRHTVLDECIPQEKESVLVSGPDADIVVSKKRSLEAAGRYAKKKKVCVLNFASATNPGGGVRKGSSAQEECLCRCSTLYPCISDHAVRNGFHERHKTMLSAGEMNLLYNDDCIYTPDVVVFKSDTLFPQILPESEWYMVDVITCAAPNLRSKSGNYMNPGPGIQTGKVSDSELADLHTKRANRILDIAKANGDEVVIMGAFGCGAFQNQPAAVAAGIRKAVNEHRRDFHTIEFAVYCSPRDTANYDVFRKLFAEEEISK